MSKRSLLLQAKKLHEIAEIKPYTKRLASLSYTVLPKVYAGGTDTALLCSLLDVKKDEEFWDIGTGTGLVALYAKKKSAKYVLATDISPYARKNAILNSKNLGLKITVKEADVFGTIRKRFDVITFNPPFTDHQVEKDYQVCFWDIGNTATKTFFSGIRNHLKPNGRAFICWSSFADKTLLKKLARENRCVIIHKGRRTGDDRGFYYDVYKVTPDKSGPRNMTTVA